MNQQKGQETQTKYRELAQKWTNISSGIDRHNNDMKDVLDQRLKRIEDRVGHGTSQQDSRFKVFPTLTKFIKQEVGKLAVDLQHSKVETLQIVEMKDNQLGQISQAMKSLQQTQRQEKQLQEQQLVTGVDQKMLIVTAAMAKVSRETMVGVQQKRLLVKNQLSFIREQLEAERRAREQRTRALTEDIQNELAAFHQQLGIQRRVREQSQAKLFGIVEELGEELKHKMDAQRKQRQATNECLLKLLEDTCVKISQNFSM